MLQTHGEEMSFTKVHRGDLEALSLGAAYQQDWSDAGRIVQDGS